MCLAAAMMASFRYLRLETAGQISDGGMAKEAVWGFRLINKC